MLIVSIQNKITKEIIGIMKIESLSSSILKGILDKSPNLIIESWGISEELNANLEEKET